MAQREKGGRVVFIGNIPYGVSEEQIMDIFGRCGQVVNFRLVYDKETGQPKGFGFLEYTDVDAAASAVRNLNEFDLNGRTLRVDYSNDNRAGGGNQNQNQNQNNQNNNNNDSNRAPPPAHSNMPPNGARPDPSALPPLPQGINLPPGVTAFDAISQTISKVDTPQLLDFISQLKNLCQSNPAQASALLQSAPQLGYAVFQAMLLLNLVDTNVVAQLIQTAGGPAPVQPPPAQQAPPPQQYAPPQPPQGYPPQPPQGYPPQPPQGYPPTHYAAPTPPQAPAYQPPAQQAPQPPQVGPEQAALIQQVMALPREQILAMEPTARAQLMQIRQMYGAPV
ncbi:Cleavage stimulation factor subunit 2 tau variant [Lecanosticta acicola]|uniref:Cleavage stimulation factor subunit 2 tau variant n=1 Tax=Lecanosticta acicola TaxID=111012 RepID=A0AAI9EB63_9PEZI|nr:Cleavage stimulation factor subunit 2 tau variant [Lecanosticta acicola]